MNYIGGKYKLLKQILPNFPKEINTFIDLFAGGGNVGVNVSAKQIILNDSDNYLYNIYQVFQQKSKTDILSMIEDIISEFSLSESSKYGYEYYSCSSNQGLQNYNKKDLIV